MILQQGRSNVTAEKYVRKWWNGKCEYKREERQRNNRTRIVSVTDGWMIGILGHGSAVRIYLAKKA
jgi:hypothetical protein